MTEELFDNWNSIKKITEKTDMKLTIKSRDIFWAKIGQNIGHEEFGKGDNFLRPLIIIRQLTTDLFIAIPTTTSNKIDNDYFHNINYKDKNGLYIKSVAMILQFRVFSKKRLLNKIGTLKKEEFEAIKTKLKNLIDPTQKVGLPEGEL